MPVKIKADFHLPKPTYYDMIPDVNWGPVPPPSYDSPCLFSMERLDPVYGSREFYALPVAEQERLLARYRFRGVRLRSDIKDRTVPISRETIDIP